MSGTGSCCGGCIKITWTLHPADAALNLPEEKHSHRLRKLAAAESARGSFESAR